MYNSCYFLSNRVFSKLIDSCVSQRQLAPGVFRVFGSLMGLDMQLTSATKRRIRMSGMQRGERAANCTNRHCFHLSVSVSALEDWLISLAPGLRFKHLSAPPSLFLFLCQPASVSQRVSPLACLYYGHDEGSCGGLQAACEAPGWTDRWTGCAPVESVSLKAPGLWAQSTNWTILFFYSCQCLESEVFH